MCGLISLYPKELYGQQSLPSEPDETRATPRQVPIGRVRMQELKRDECASHQRSPTGPVQTGNKAVSHNVGR